MQEPVYSMKAEEFNYEVVCVPNTTYKYTYTQSYKYLNNGNGRESTDCLLDNHKLLQKTNEFIIRTETGSQKLNAGDTYNYFNDIDSFISWRNNKKQSDWCYHEMIFGNRPIKLAFDIDYYTKDLSRVIDIKKAIIQWLREEIVLLTCYGLDCDFVPDIIIVDSSSLTKVSWHIVVANLWLANFKECAYIAKRIQNNLTTDYLFNDQLGINHIVDMGLYKATSSLRLPYCHKITNPERVAKIYCVNSDTDKYNFNKMFKKCCITEPAPANYIIPKKRIVEEIKSIKLTNELKQEVIKTLEEYLGASHKFRDYTKGGIYNFDRLAPSFCKLCNRIHDSDNTAYGIVSNVDIQCKCRHGKGHIIVAALPWLAT